MGGRSGYRQGDPGHIRTLKTIFEFLLLTFTLFGYVMLNGVALAPALQVQVSISFL